MSGKTAIMAELGPGNAIGELAGEKPGGLSAGEAFGAIRELSGSDPAAAEGLRRRFRSWSPARQAEAIGDLAGNDPARRRSWTRLPCGILELPGGDLVLA